MNDADLHASLLAEVDELLRHAPAEAAIDGIDGELTGIALEHRGDRATQRPGEREDWGR